MIYIAICDNDKIYCDSIKNAIGTFFEDKTDINYHIDIYNSGISLLDKGSEILKYHICFLDVNMEKIDGLETAKKIRTYSRGIFIVFITAYVKYSLQGYEVGAIRFLLKDSRLKFTINESLRAIFLEMNTNIEPPKKKFNFSGGEKTVTLSTIFYIESNLHKLDFYVMEKEPRHYTIRCKLDDIEELLSGNGFIRIHKSYLANIEHIRIIDGHKVLLTNDMSLPISKARYKQVKNSFIEYSGDI